MLGFPIFGNPHVLTSIGPFSDLPLPEEISLVKSNVVQSNRYTKPKR